MQKESSRAVCRDPSPDAFLPDRPALSRVNPVWAHKPVVRLLDPCWPRDDALFSLVGPLGLVVCQRTRFAAAAMTTVLLLAAASSLGR